MDAGAYDGASVRPVPDDDDKFIGRVGAPSLHAKSETPIVFPAYVPAFDRWPR